MVETPGTPNRTATTLCRPITIESSPTQSGVSRAPESRVNTSAAATRSAAVNPTIAIVRTGGLPVSPRSVNAAKHAPAMKQRIEIAGSSSESIAREVRYEPRRERAAEQDGIARHVRRENTEPEERDGVGVSGGER